MAEQNFPLLTIGTIVSYKDTQGRIKPAMVIGTPSTINPNGSVPVPQPGFFHLKVVGYGQHDVVKFDVPYEAVAQDIPDYTVEGELRGVILSTFPAY